MLSQKAQDVIPTNRRYFQLPVKARFLPLVRMTKKRRFLTFCEYAVKIIPAFIVQVIWLIQDEM